MVAPGTGCLAAGAVSAACATPKLKARRAAEAIRVRLVLIVFSLGLIYLSHLNPRASDALHIDLLDFVISSRVVMPGRPDLGKVKSCYLSVTSICQPIDKLGLDFQRHL